jgi:hypothetical protein
MDPNHAQTDYGNAQRARLDAKVALLRAEGWDVVPRRERDLALSQRDSALAVLETAVSELADWRDKGGDVMRDELVDDFIEAARAELNAR